MAQIDALVDDKAFDLMEHRRMRRVTVGTINPARRDDANRRFLPGHRADLHGRSMSAQQHAMPVALVREIACVVPRSEEHTSELQSLMRISYAVFRLKKKKNTITQQTKP